ncbi:serine hydrolase [Psychromicrobium sp. YIM B11713]|uniref:serine hydrolase n=1 Tax=Psychromicrobium sp. YIM B11713 TaxID=3145233 RepID=UPI00374F4429
MPVSSDYSDGTPLIAYCLTTLDGEVLAQRNADTHFYSASTIKLAVLVAALHAVERGALRLDQPFASTHTFNSRLGGTFSFDPDEYDDGMAPEGASMSLQELLGRMISVSSNEATNLLVEALGFPAVMEALRRCGANDSTMERLIGDLAALQRGFSHQITAADLCKIMSFIVSGRAAGPQNTALAVNWLREQRYPVIGEELKEMNSALDWGSKSGWVTGIQHDVAFVIPREAAPGEGYLLAICTRALADPEAAETIRALSRALLPL